MNEYNNFWYTVYFSIYDELFKSYTKTETDNTLVANIAYVA